MKKKLTQAFGFLFFVIGIILLFSVAGVTESVGMSRMDAIFRIVSAFTIALIGVTLLNRKGTEA